MNLLKIIKSTNWLSIQLTLINLYPDQEEQIDEYRKVFEKLINSEMLESDMIIQLKEVVDDWEGETSSYVDVSGISKVKDPNTLSYSCAIEFVEWRKWLGMDLSTETMENFTDLEIIAHCLYEMTFVSFEEEEIKEQWDAITDSVEEYKNLTEEERKEKTISLDELKKRLDEDKSS